MKTIGVVGAGTMGSGIAQVFAQAGYNVYLHDAASSAVERAIASIETRLKRNVEKQLCSSQERDATLTRLVAVPSLDDFAGVDYVVEAAAEAFDVKSAIFVCLDRVVRPDVVLASNTSSISITRIAATTQRPAQVVGMHVMNPAPVMALVELVRGHVTSDATMQAAADLCTAVGKHPVEARDFPGFIANRVLLPMINEAIYALMEGVGTAESIDDVMRTGLNHRMGPLELADLIGLDICLAILNVLHDGFGDPKCRPCPLLKRLVAADHLGRKSGRAFYEYP